jgi:hypothetical protein
MLARHTEPSHALPSTVALAQPRRRRVHRSRWRIQYINGKAFQVGSGDNRDLPKTRLMWEEPKFAMMYCARTRENESEASDDAYSSLCPAVRRVQMHSAAPATWLGVRSYTKSAAMWWRRGLLGLVGALT